VNPHRMHTVCTGADGFGRRVEVAGDYEPGKRVKSFSGSTYEVVLVEGVKLWEYIQQQEITSAVYVGLSRNHEEFMWLRVNGEVAYLSETKRLALATALMEGTKYKLVMTEEAKK
jgi:hypothetical protein